MEDGPASGRGSGDTGRADIRGQPLRARGQEEGRQRERRKEKGLGNSYFQESILGACSSLCDQIPLKVLPAADTYDFQGSCMWRAERAFLSL